MSYPEEYKTKALKAFEEADYYEVYGVEFTKGSDQLSKSQETILFKFYKANERKVDEAVSQLLKTLKWRKEFNPLAAAEENVESNMCKLGVVTKSPGGKVVTWNLYGAIKDPGDIFKAQEKFIRWRVGLHEQALKLLDFEDETLSYMDQVHDYMNVSFLRMNSNIRKTSSKVIELFQAYYPETLNAKYFVNVPYIMMWAFRLIRTFTSEATTAKFQVLANGEQLAKDLGTWVPRTYGGTADCFQGPSIEPTAETKEMDNAAQSENLKVNTEKKKNLPQSEAPKVATDEKENVTEPVETEVSTGEEGTAPQPEDINAKAKEDIPQPEEQK